MENLPYCLDHNRQISHIDTNIGTPKGKRVLCPFCVLNRPQPIEQAIQLKIEKSKEEIKLYEKLYNQCLAPIQEFIKSLATLKNEFCKIIEMIECNLTQEKEKIINEKERILKSLNLDCEHLTISKLQDIGEELSQQNQNNFQQDKNNLEKQLDNIMNSKELILLSEIKSSLDQIQSQFQQQEFLKNIKDGQMKFHQFQKKQFSLDCYATAINKSETLLVVSHNIELKLFEIKQDGINELDMIKDFGFFYEIVFDKNDENLLYLGDYNSCLRAVRIQNRKMKIVNSFIKFDLAVPCLVCNSNSEVIVSSQDLSFRSYKLVDEVFTLIQDIGGVDKEISSITLSQDETMMATSHINFVIKIWEKKEKMWSISQDISTNRESMIGSQIRLRKDRNAVCFLKLNILAYLTDTGILRFYKKDESDTFQYFMEYQYSVDNGNHFPCTYSLRFNYDSGMLVCHQYHKLSVLKQNEDGLVQEFQEINNIKHQIVGCSLSLTFLVAQDSQNFTFYILKLRK
ncbi:unnamed protein product [Paramecium pentaurelia]|uniref:Uncharacterized protein n=1 Tax=Paramecium pentaurelia TaxID=43138 RepID=A0A8S1XFA7_9CILI|nr:unnamed protein product [Paramecium pentaurelia]